MARQPQDPLRNERPLAKLNSKQAIDGGDVRLAGKFRLELRSDGTYTSFQELDGETDGRYRMASGDRLVFKQDKG